MEKPTIEKFGEIQQGPHHQQADGREERGRLTEYRLACHDNLDWSVC